jgi:hypothetical protein
MGVVPNSNGTAGSCQCFHNDVGLDYLGGRFRSLLRTGCKMSNVRAVFSRTSCVTRIDSYATVGILGWRTAAACMAPYSKTP